MQLRSLLLGAILATTEAFTPVPMMPRALARQRPVLASAPAPPVTKVEVKTKQKVANAPDKIQAKEAVALPNRETESKDVPMWKVLLIGDEEYDEAYVVQTIKQVVVNIERKKCEEVFQEASLHGSAEIIIVPQEHAEHYVQQFHRCDPIVFAACEPENGEE